MKVLIVTQVGDLHPSGYVRAYIYRDYFKKAGIDATYVDRKSAVILRLVAKWRLFALPLRLLVFLRSLWIDRWILKNCVNYDVVFMSKIVSEDLMRQIRKAGVPIVLDFVDSVWLPNHLVTNFMGCVQLATVVTTDNPFNAEHVGRLNPSTQILPDPPQVEVFDEVRKQGLTKMKEESVVLGWVGSPGTLYNLFLIWEPLEALFLKYSNIHLRLVGTGSDLSGRLPPFERVSYSTRASYDQRTMVDEVLSMDVGLFPLQDLDTCRGRGFLKAAVYMAGGVPVVGSPVGQSADDIVDGLNGFLPRSCADWVNVLSRLIEDSNLRKGVGQAGLEYVRKHYSIESCFQKLSSTLSKAAKTQTRSSYNVGILSHQIET